MVWNLCLSLNALRPGRFKHITLHFFNYLEPNASPNGLSAVCWVSQMRLTKIPYLSLGSLCSVLSLCWRTRYSSTDVARAPYIPFQRLSEYTNVWWCKHHASQWFLICILMITRSSTWHMTRECCFHWRVHYYMWRALCPVFVPFNHGALLTYAVSL